MKNSKVILLGAVATSVLLSACGGSDGDSSNSAVDNNPSNTVIDPSAPAFFNSESGFDYADTLVGRFIRMLRPVAAVSSGLSAKRTIAAVEELTINCNDGGSVALTLTTDDSTGEPSSLAVNFNACVEEGATSDGGISIDVDLDENGDTGTIALAVDNFSVTGVDPVAIDGSILIAMQTVGSQSTFSVSGPNLSMTADGETVVFGNYSLTVVSDEITDAASVSASLSLESNTEGSLTLVIDPPLAGGDSDDYPTSGQITMTHSDGSSLTMNADNGNPSTFDYTINDRGAISTGVGRWDETELGGLDQELDDL